MQEINIYVETAAKGPREQTAAYIYLLELKTQKGPATLTKRGTLSGTKNRIEITALKMALERVNMQVSVHLYLTSDYVFHAINNGYVDKWAKNGWKNAKGDMVSNWEEWEETLNLLNGKPFYLHKNEQHEYKNWMQLELKKESQERRKQ